MSNAPPTQCQHASGSVTQFSQKDDIRQSAWEWFWHNFDFCHGVWHIVNWCLGVWQTSVTLSTYARASDTVLTQCHNVWHSSDAILTWVRVPDIVLTHYQHVSGCLRDFWHIVNLHLGVWHNSHTKLACVRVSDIVLTQFRLESGCLAQVWHSVNLRLVVWHSSNTLSTCIVQKEYSVINFFFFWNFNVKKFTFDTASDWNISLKRTQLNNTIHLREQLQTNKQFPAEKRPIIDRKFIS